MACNLRRLALATAVMLVGGPAMAAPVEIQWWHSMTGTGNALLNRFAADFNASQPDYKIVPVYKGSYPDTLNSGIAAFRAHQAPHILQVFEVGTATMMAAKGAIKPVWELMAEAGEPLDAGAYLPAIAAYYSTPDGKLVSMPFNSSTPVLYYNKDAFRKAGLDPEAPPATWPEFLDDGRKLAAVTGCGFTVGWMAWTQFEVLSAWHDVPFASRGNGLDGPDAVLEVNGPLQVRHLQDLVTAEANHSFEYGGRQDEPDGKFIAGNCAMIQTSSGFYGTVKADAKFDFGIARLPYYPDVPGAPQNSVIGGASLWVMGGKTAAEYKGVAKFFTFLGQTALQKEWHEKTGYMPVTRGAYDAAKAEGFYAKSPGLEVAIHQLLDKPPTENTRGLRLGNLPQIRNAVADEVEAALAGDETAQQALDKAKARGDRLLRNFQKTAGG